MFWDRKKDDHDDHGGVVRYRLKPELQNLADREEELFDLFYDGSSADSLDTSYRYAGYATRIRTLLLSAHRYVAYTSDIGESFRPVAHPWIVRSAYGISWAYILGDVANEGYKAYLRNRAVLCPQTQAYRDATVAAASGDKTTTATPTPTIQHPHPDTLQSTMCKTHPMPWIDPEEDTLTPWNTVKIPISEDYRSIMAERAVFQGLASMGLPALTIHTIVKYSGRALKGSKTTFMRTWAPIGLGLSVVPFLPYIFDEPVEHGVKWTFSQAFRAIGGAEFEPREPNGEAPVEQNRQCVDDARQRRREARERRRAERQKLIEKEE